MECSHEPCTCRVVEAGQFCSESCGLGTQTGPFCGCGHAECQATRVGSDPFSDGGPL
jgi:hypothetical protein